MPSAEKEKPKKWGWGGWRPGAGRKPSANRVEEPHRARPHHDPDDLIQATWPVAKEVPLRDAAVARTVEGAIKAAIDYDTQIRRRFKILKWEIGSRQITVTVWAGSKLTLTRGLRGLGIRVARSVNRELKRTGRFFTDRYRAQVLPSKTSSFK